MRKWLASLLRRWANWLDPLPSFQGVGSILIEEAKLLTSKQNKELHSGSYKRVMVMKELMIKYPNISKRDLSLAIEIALR